MDEKELAELMKDENFVKKMLSAPSREEVKKLFSERGLEVTDNNLNFLSEIIAKVISSKDKLSEEELENISGGTISPLAATTIGVCVATVIGTYGLYHLGKWALYKCAENIARNIKT